MKRSTGSGNSGLSSARPRHVTVRNCPSAATYVKTAIWSKFSRKATPESQNRILSPPTTIKSQDYVKARKAGINLNEGRNPPRRQELTYPLWAKNSFSVLTRMTSDEPLMTVSMMMASSREGFSKRPRIIMDLEVARA